MCIIRASSLDQSTGEDYPIIAALVTVSVAQYQFYQNVLAAQYTGRADTYAAYDYLHTISAHWVTVPSSQFLLLLQAARQHPCRISRTSGQMPHTDHPTFRSAARTAGRDRSTASLPPALRRRAEIRAPGAAIGSRDPFRGRSMRHIRNKRHNKTYGAGRALAATSQKNTANTVAPPPVSSALASARSRRQEG